MCRPISGRHGLPYVRVLLPAHQQDDAQPYGIVHRLRNIESDVGGTIGPYGAIPRGYSDQLVEEAVEVFGRKVGAVNLNHGRAYRAVLSEIMPNTKLVNTGAKADGARASGVIPR